MARPDRPLHRPRRAARSAGRGEREVLCRVRPDRAEPAHGQPGPAGHRAPPAGRGPHAVHPRRRRHRHDRRPARLRRADAQLPRHRQGVERQGARPGLALRVLRGWQRRHGRQQLRLDRIDVGDRLPARHRQALPGQPDALARDGQAAPRVGHQLHRVLLHPPAVHGLPQSLPRPRRHAAVRWLRPVGQPHRRRRAGAARDGGDRRTPSPPRW